MKDKHQKRKEALARLDENIKMRERSLGLAKSLEDKESEKFLKTKLTNLHRDRVNLMAKL